jgi:hypothetical protein
MIESKIPSMVISFGGIKSVVVPTAARYLSPFRISIFNACRPANNKTVIHIKDFNTYEIVSIQNAYLVHSAVYGKVDHMRMEILRRKSVYRVGLWSSSYDYVMQRYESLIKRLPASLEDLKEWQDYHASYSPDPFLWICGIPIMVFSFINVLYNLNEMELEVSTSLRVSKYKVIAYLQSLADEFKRKAGGDFSTAIKNLRNISYLLI